MNTDIKETGLCGADWDRQRALVNTVMILRLL
jgi:hypothetical protein